MPFHCRFFLQCLQPRAAGRYLSNSYLDLPQRQTASSANSENPAAFLANQPVQFASNFANTRTFPETEHAGPPPVQ